ncbi:MAG: hypothetical protein WBX00_24600 [Isosphaeraceae bacterium]
MNPDAHSRLAVPGLVPPRHRNGRRSWRWMVNLWLVFHLVAIIIAPAAMYPSSELARSVHGVCQPYLEALYLDHGYHFFAPEPEESTLLSFEAERPDGTVVRGRIPNRATQPRLLYHRYFMLTEHMNQSPEEFRDRWHESYARHLGREYGASRVKLIQQTHLLSSMERIREGGRLTDPESYEDHPLGDFPCDVY